MCRGLPSLCGELHKNGDLKRWWRALSSVLSTNTLFHQALLAFAPSNQ